MNSTTIRFRFRAIAVACVLCAGGFFGAIALRSEPNPAGLPNFGQVTDTLYRGAQPSAAGFHSLQQMGVTIVVNFRNDGEAVREKGEVESLGMKYIDIPWSGRQEPSTTQVVQFLDLVRDNPQDRIFVHCQRGADRTGTMVAAYRIAVQHRPVADAVSEMMRFHYAHFWLPQLERYVDSLPQLLQTDGRFSAYAPVPAMASTAAPALATTATPAAR